MAQESIGEKWLIKSGLDVLILLIFAPGRRKHEGEPIEGITRLDKLMFILSQNPHFKKYLKVDYKFQAYNYGPFAIEIFDDLEVLTSEGIVLRKVSSKSGSAIETKDAEWIDRQTLEREDVSWQYYSVESYSLTERGLEAARCLWNGLSVNEKEALIDLKKKYNQMPLRQLLKYVYTKYPRFAAESVIAERILK